MTGSEKLAATLVGAILMMSALGATGQQPSAVAEDARQETSAAPASAATRTPADMPPNLPKVTCEGGALTISAQNSTLGGVLNAIRACTGAEIDMPEAARGERLFAELGPGPVRAVLAELLSSTDYNYVIKALPSDPQRVQLVQLNPHPNDSSTQVANEVASNPNLSTNRQAWLETRHNYEQSFAAGKDESSPPTDAVVSPSVETAAAPADSVPAETEPGNPAPEAFAGAVPVARQIAPASTQSGAAPDQGKSTSEMISDMQRMFEQRKQMVQQQTVQQPTGTVH